jgi:predicted GNAT superfamily acetyltransferase
MAAELVQLNDITEIRELADLFAEVWGRPGSPPIGSDVLKALAHSGNYVVGAYRDQRLIGGLVGWLGGEPRRELHMHSHILGVLPGIESHGLGFELKQHQRWWCLERGVNVMEWTTDPLVRRNGYFNLTKLGALAPEYLVNVYGEMKDGINAGEESDRLLIRWKLDSPEARAAAAGGAREPDVEGLRASGAQVLLSVGESSSPSPSPLNGERGTPSWCRCRRTSSPCAVSSLTWPGCGASPCERRSPARWLAATRSPAPPASAGTFSSFNRLLRWTTSVGSRRQGS